jgi:hypothetical protein
MFVIAIMLHGVYLFVGLIATSCLVMTAIVMHVTYGDAKKRVTSTLEDLRQTLQASFVLTDQDFGLQSWDDEFQDWVDLDDEAQLEGLEKCKLQIIVR